jgi:hypothetical protein
MQVMEALDLAWPIISGRQELPYSRMSKGNITLDEGETIISLTLQNPDRQIRIDLNKISFPDRCPFLKGFCQCLKDSVRRMVYIYQPNLYDYLLDEKIYLGRFLEIHEEDHHTKIFSDTGLLVEGFNIDYKIKCKKIDEKIRHCLPRSFLCRAIESMELTGI